MTFLNPLVLFGMIAAAIPVILHLLNLRKLRTIEFSSLRFLKELQQTKIRRLKFRQILLLIIRTLLVLAIVLAFARPAMRGSLLGTIGANAHSSVVFIIDDSFSMSASDERGELLKQAKEGLIKLTDLLNEGDEVFFIKLSDLPDATIEQGTHDFQSLKKTISEIQISGVTRQIDDALRVSARLLSQSSNANKEVYVISDMQQTLFRELIVNKGRQQAMFDPTVKFFLLDLGKNTSGNVAIDSVGVRTQILEKDKPVGVYSSVRNFSNNTIQNYVVSVFLEGVRVAQNSVRLEPWGSATLEFTITPKKSGFLKGYVELEHDAIEEDNRRYFTMFVPEKISVAIVNNSPADGKFLELALRSGAQQSTQSLFEVKQTTSKEFQFLDLEKIDVLFVTISDGISSSSIERLKTFAENGGGIILFPGSNFQHNDMSAQLLSTLSIRPIEGITGSESAGSSLSFKEIDLDHPIFATVFEKDDRSATKKQVVESPTILKTLKRVSGKEARTIIALSDGSSFFSEHNKGSGRILFFSVAPTLTWSDFPVRGIFAPLMYRSAIYVSSRGKTHFSFTTGDESSLTLPNVPIALRSGMYKLISPDGVEEFVSQSGRNEPASSGFKQTGATLTVRLKKLLQPGFYQFMNQSELLTLIVVNTDKKESDGRKINEEQLTGFWEHYGIEASKVTMLEQIEEAPKTVMESRLGVELWKHCIVLALLLALLEMLIARDSRKEMQQAFNQ